MKRERTVSYPELSNWIKQPIHTGSIYIKPTQDKQGCCTKCFSYLHFFFCCVCIR